MNIQAVRLPTSFTQVGKYVVGALAVIVLYKIYQAFTTRRWTDQEIVSRVGKEELEKEWRKRTVSTTASSNSSDPTFKGPRISFEPLKNGSFKVGVRDKGDKPFQYTIYGANESKKAITAVTYESGYFIIARGGAISKLYLSRGEVEQSWLKTDHTITELKLYNGLVRATGSGKITFWDLGAQTKPDIIDRLWNRVILSFIG